MELADFIRLGDQAPRLRFLIIGGWAVGAHGYTRSTFDVDFMVRQVDRDAWMQRAVATGLSLFQESKTFAQFTQQDADGFDLMFVDAQVFNRIWDASERRSFEGLTARIPCLDHLLALKLHALKQSLAHRTAKDADDVEILLRNHQINLSDPHYRELFLKYGTQELYDTFVRLLHHT